MKQVEQNLEVQSPMPSFSWRGLPHAEQVCAIRMDSTESRATIRGFMAKLIKAFHQVGGDDTTSKERRAILREIRSRGEILPAVDRVDRSEMFQECFGDAQGSQDVESFWSSPQGEQALTLIAKDKLQLLRYGGSTHTMFNCLDLIAGDFELVFLSIGTWYSYPSGFVFDAEELIREGAGYRPRDLLGYYREAVERTSKLTYDSVEDARRAIEEEIELVRDEFESKGKQAITLLRNDCAKECPGEIVWPGPLPLGLAIETWREGRRVTSQEGVRR